MSTKRGMVFMSKCRYCGQSVADKWLARHLQKCPKNPDNQKK